MPTEGRRKRPKGQRAPRRNRKEMPDNGGSHNGKCARMTKEAEDAADRAWRDAQARIQKLIDDQAGLRELLTAFSKGSK